MLVVDASIILSLLLDDEHVIASQAIVEALEHHGGIAPTLLWYEVRNALIVNERRKRISRQDSALVLDTLSLLPIRIMHNPPSEKTLGLARKHELSVYDAAYLDLAIEQNGFLASLDRKLIAAAQAEGIQNWNDVLRQTASHT